MEKDFDNNGMSGISRRAFLKTSALAGCAALAASQLELVHGLLARAEAGELVQEEMFALMQAENSIFTTCLNCNTGCGIKVMLLNGVAIKIDGSAYSPFCLHPHLPMSEPITKVAMVDAPICPKGQSGHQGAYDPYRIRKVLKRAGTRGEGKWTSIPFDQAVTEIVNGGNLFSSVLGEEKRHITGLGELYALRDPVISDGLRRDVNLLKSKQLTVADFKKKHAANLHLLIDPDHPDFGPKNNQLVYLWGKQKGGRSDFAKRFTDAFGTVNTHGNTTVCQGSLYFACKAMSEQYTGNGFGDGQKFYWQADQENAAYILFVGSNLFDANYGPTNRTPRMTQRLLDGDLKIAVVDPRFSKLASKAERWVPIKPGTDGAFAMGMTRWILENKRFDAKYLINANKAGAKWARETTWSNATWLVKIEVDGRPGPFLRASEIGLKPAETRIDKNGKSYPFEYLVIMKSGAPAPFDPDDEKFRSRGDLFVSATLTGGKTPIKVKSSLQLMLEASQEKSLAEYASICGIDQKVIEEVAREFTSHGKKACVDMHRGPSQHTNGFYTISALMNLNLLVGNFDWQGGMITGATFNYDGTGNASQPFNLKTLAPKTGKPFGLSIIRHDAHYENSTLFDGYPAKRNWWPLASDVYQEILPSISDAYPYPIKALFSYMGTPVYALPSGQTGINMLTDLERIPLYFASDITIGTTSQYADYIFPDLHYLERWEFQGSHPNMPVRVQPVRHPVIASPNEVVTVFGEEQPISVETLWLALAEKLRLPGFGKDALGQGRDLARPDDLYLRMVANLAFDRTETGQHANWNELNIFMKSHSHLPKNMFDLKRWEKISIENLSNAIFILNRGGRFDTADNAFRNDHAMNSYGKLINLYQEHTAMTRDAFTGLYYHGMARYVPISDTLDRVPSALSHGYDLQLISHKDVRMTNARTNSNQYLTELMPDNTIIISVIDAHELRFKEGDEVKVVSASNQEGVWELGRGIRKPMAGKIHLTETIRPGVVTIAHGHGNWSGGATDYWIDGLLIKGDKRRGGGINANAALWMDPNLKNSCMMDKVGGSVSFFDTMVRLVKTQEKLS